MGDSSLSILPHLKGKSKDVCSRLAGLLRPWLFRGQAPGAPRARGVGGSGRGQVRPAGCQAALHRLDGGSFLCYHFSQEKDHRSGAQAKAGVLGRSEVITVTSEAVKKLKAILEEEAAQDSALRVIVVPAEHGVQYMLSLEKEPKSDDVTLEQEGLRIVVDSDSAPILEGAQIDYVEDMMRTGFVISNPNVAAGGGCACGGKGCGCGGH